MDFSASINPLGPPQSAIAAIHDHLIYLRDYPDPHYGELRQALAQHHHLDPAWILPGNGSAELLTWACRDLADLNATMLFTPAFGDYGRALTAFGAHVVLHPLEIPWLKHWKATTPSSIEAADSAASMLDYVRAAPSLDEVLPQAETVGVLVNNPHNPTGQLFSRASLQPYLDACALVVVDEAFMDFLTADQQQSVIDWVATHPNLVVLRSLTKFYSLPGLRLGYAIAHPDRLRRWQQWRDPWSVNTLAAAAAIAVLRDNAFQEQTWAWLASARSQLFRNLSSLPGLQPLPGAANYLLVHTAVSATQLQRQLLQQHQIFIRDCVSFAELGDRFFRVAVRTEAENQRLFEGLQAVLTSPP